jgi:hypothetical protein
MTTPMSPRPHASARTHVTTFIYGWPLAVILEQPGLHAPDQLFSDAGEQAHDWSLFAPPEFAGIVIETLLFDWYAVVHVDGHDPHGFAHPQITLAETLWAREHTRAQELAYSRTHRRS